MTPRRLPACLLIALFALLALGASSAHAAAQVLVLDDPITDNYKASYNADPSQPELRTWLAMKTITVAGTTWRPVAPDAISVTAGSSIELVAGDGRSGTLAAQLVSGPMKTPIVRSDPYSAASGGRWGQLATLTDRDALRSAHAVLRLTLESGGEQVGVGTISYRYDAALAGVPQGHIEYNGPGGRWYVGSTATRTQEEPAPATPPSIRAAVAATTVQRPRIRRVMLPLRTSRRFAPLRVFGRNAGGVRITHLRVRIGARGWSRWTRTRARYTLILPRGNRAHGVRIQLRDARGRTSQVVRRRVRCFCG